MMHDETLKHETAAGDGGADPSADFVTIPRVEFETLRATAATEVGRRERESDDARRLAELDRQVAEWQTAYKAAVRDRELVTALAGRPLVPGAAAQLLKLWRDEFDVLEEDGRPRVVCRDGRPAERAVADWLASPEFAHFRPPASRGGTASPGEPRQVAAPNSPPSPRNLGESLLQRWRVAATGASDSPAPVGLGRRR